MPACCLLLKKGVRPAVHLLNICADIARISTTRIAVSERRQHLRNIFCRVSYTPHGFFRLSTLIIIRMHKLISLFLNLALGGIKRQIVIQLTSLLAALAFYIVVLVISLVCLMLTTIGVGHLLATTIAPHFAYLIIAAFYIILLAIICAFRRQIIFQPIRRIVAHIIR